MGFIPEYKRAPLRPSVNASGAGQEMANMGQALSAVGGLVTQGASLYAQLERKNQNIQNKNDFLDLNQEYQAEVNKAVRDHQKAFELNPVGSTEAHLKQKLQDIRQDYMMLAPNKDVANQLGQATSAYAFSAEQSMLDWETPQNIKATATRTADGLEKEIIKVVNNPNADQYKQVVAASQDYLNNLGEAAGEVTKMEAQTAFRRQLSGSYFTSLINNNNLQQAEAELKSGAYDEDLGPKGINAVKKQLKSKRTSNANKLYEMQMLAYKDPYKYIAKTTNTNVMQLDLDGWSPKGFAARDALYDQYKPQLPNMKYLNNLEVEILGDKIDNQSAEANAAMVNNLIETNDIPTMKKVVNSLWDLSEDHRTFAVAAVTLPDDQKAGRDIMRGIKIMGEKPGNSPYALPKKTEAKEFFNDYVGNTYDNEEVHDAVFNASLASYVSEKHRTNQLDGSINEKEFLSHIDRIKGPTISLNGQATISFRDPNGQWLEGDRFSILMGGLTTDDTARFLGDYPQTIKGETIELKNAKDRISLQAIGDGEYLMEVEMRDKQGRWRPMAAMSGRKKNQPFILNLKSLYRDKYWLRRQSPMRSVMDQVNWMTEDDKGIQWLEDPG